MCGFVFCLSCWCDKQEISWNDPKRNHATGGFLQGNPKTVQSQSEGHSLLSTRFTFPFLGRITFRVPKRLRSLRCHGRMEAECSLQGETDVSDALPVPQHGRKVTTKLGYVAIWTVLSHPESSSLGAVW